MLVSRNLLIEFAPKFKNIKDNEFIDACNKIGIEVEQILNHPITNGLKVVKILSIQKHPNADKLNLVNIKLPDNEEKIIVCGADNLKENHYAIFAPKGTKLHNGIILDEREIRGIKSEGMLCAFSELTNIGIENISEQSKTGIIIFEKEIRHDDIPSFLGLDDKLYELSIPSNRNDLNSIFCFLAELSLHLSLDFSLNSEFIFKNTNKNLKIHLDDEICKNFSMIKISNYSNFSLSIAQKQILSSSGFKVNDNFLDVANLIFMLSGNPIHIYDSKSVKDAIEIKKLNSNSKLLALDGKEYDLKKGFIVAKNKKDEILSLPFVIGSEASRFNSDSNEAIIEIGNFDHLLVRRAMNELKISSKSSQIGNKMISNYNTQLALNLLLRFLDNNNMTYEYNYVFENLTYKTIDVDFENMEKFIGFDFNKNEIISLMNKTTFNIKGNKVEVHPSRLDIDNQYDFYEEVMKIIDINKLDVKPINFNVLSFENNSEKKNIDKIDNFFLDNGFMQVKTYNLSSKERAKKFDFLNLFSDIHLINPISNIREYLKSNSICELLDIIKYNFSRKHKLFNIYEISKIQTSLEKSNNILSTLFVDNFYSSKISNSLVSNNILNIKSFFTTIFNEFFVSFELKDNVVLIKSKNNTIGHIFMIDKNVKKDYDLEDFDNDIYGSIINLDLLVKKENNISINTISPYPFVVRDYNFVVNKNGNNINDIVFKIKEMKYIHDVEIIDTFDKDDSIIYTLSITISCLEKTLNTDEINKIMDIVKNISF